MMNKTACSIITFVICFMPLLTFAHFDKKANSNISETDIIITYTKNISNKTLSILLTSETDYESIPIKNATVGLYYILEEQNTKITDLLTGEDGNVEYNLPDVYPGDKNEDGVFIWTVIYEGDENSESFETSIELIDVDMNIGFSTIDSVKSIVTTVYELIPNNERRPAEELDVYFFTPSLFGLLPIGDGWVEDGECTIEFPTDLPGDVSGNLTIIAKIMENELYGDVISTNNIQWAKKLVIPEAKHKQLWTTDPPTWMIVVLIFLLSAVWSHYWFVFIKLFRIRKTGKQ